MAFLKFRIIIENGDAKSAVADVEGQVDGVKTKAETPSNLRLNAQAALGTIRDVMLNLSSLKSVIDGVVGKANDFLNSSLKQKQAVALANIAFGEQSAEMQELASAIQSVTNHGAATGCSGTTRRCPCLRALPASPPQRWQSLRRCWLTSPTPTPP